MSYKRLPEDGFMFPGRKLRSSSLTNPPSSNKCKETWWWFPGHRGENNQINELVFIPLVHELWWPNESSSVSTCPKKMKTPQWACWVDSMIITIIVLFYLSPLKR